MTSDVRRLLHKAAELDEPVFGGAEAAMRRGVRLRWYRRVQLALPLVVVVTLVLVLARPDLPIFGDAQRIAPAHPGQREPERREATPAPRDQEREAQQRSEAAERRSRLAASPVPGDERRVPSVGSGGQYVADCSPLIDDLPGDTFHPTIDILESQIFYDAATNTLVFKHVMKDIVRDDPTEELHYDFLFVWDDLSYRVEAWIDYYSSKPGQEQYEVIRERRDDQPTNAAQDWVQLGTPTGSIDPVTDTVTVRVSIDEFNEGEDSASASERMTPPKDLEAGSKLTDISLETFSGPFGSRYFDFGGGRCDYVVGES